MKFFIENIGSIEKAEIELNNLSVICGENDSGKTTIAKIIYAVGQASSFFAKDYQLKKYDRVRDIYDELAFRISRVSRLDIRLGESLSEDIDNLQLTILNIRRNAKINANDIEMVSSLVDRITTLNSLETGDQDITNLTGILRKIVKRLKSEYEKLYEEPVQDFIFEALKSEFSNDLLHKKEGVEKASLICYEEDEKLFSLQFNNKEVLTYNLTDKLPIHDSTLIDGPYVFQIASIIHELYKFNSLGHGRRKIIDLDLPYHVIDLCAKIDGSQNTKYEFESECDWNSNDFYEGNMSFNTENHSFELFQNNKNYIANNVSSGMKSIGIIDLLYKGRFINKNSILIIDEPETNLHPKWQRIYAKSIVALANQGTNILINTHSPYMLEALKIYSDKIKIPKNKFYYTYREGNTITVNDTNGNIIPIIDALSEPLYLLMKEQGNVSDF